mgnify:FL=1
MIMLSTNGQKCIQVNIRTIDEAVVIGAALSMSSSAFVLQVCHTKNDCMYNEINVVKMFVYAL